ncbi:MAG: GNAT family N-acetyltransferase [Pseudomonadales bacterium]|nr:GNAT family N-acetyltransferase [Pseudomonadales bacterium]MBO6565157.1 GNAT family N-acetyltransferase [Pseudomonadales bacterium]MBO6594452.1 GNAT family N-acetyltransferase [Pseudomonadales bacterium]MBO6700955.1 GNAT family N-acetyltransferase [Pseudomonadales bacterium]MBO6821987.1 GNAT family N-acetyltransferase [Pseudomonadales bacterium]
MSGRNLTIRPTTSDDGDYVASIALEYFGSTQVVSRERMHQIETLSGFIAESGNERVGLIQFDVHNHELEVVTLVSRLQAAGVGRRLLEQTVDHARQQGNLSRCWLITTNNNHNAINFYRHVGWRLKATHYGAVNEARKLKPEIPLQDDRGIPIKDELEFEHLL